jgi:hypothetical protein
MGGRGYITRWAPRGEYVRLYTHVDYVYTQVLYDTVAFDL